MSSNIEYSNIRYSGLEAATYTALDLCLACKGCTSECPSGVDMPKLKYEFMNEYYKTHRRPLHDYLFGYFHVAAKLLSPVAPLANVFMKMNWSKKLIAQMVGVTDKREFPVFAARKAKLPESHKAAEKKIALFLSDVFSRYIDSDVEQAAFDILNILGYEIKVLPVIGAGASLLSKGFIDAARRHAEKVLAEIQSFDTGSIVGVVGCEPPEVYCLKHEYFALLPNRREELESITKKVWLMDEFILRVVTKGDLLIHKQDERITFHPHCHQRAEGLADDGFASGAQATVEMLRAFGHTVDVIDAGCCGIAGTFGFDAEHYELSMQVGELGVLPQVRAAGKIVSTGSACRMQIKHGAGKEVRHPLELVRDALQESDLIRSH